MLCQRFIGPLDGDTCPGEEISFTCLVDSGSISWIVTPGGADDECPYTSVTQRTDTCGPNGVFTSSRTEGGSEFNTSLSVVLTNDLSGTEVECIDSAAGGGLVDSYNICVIGESYSTRHGQGITLCCKNGYCC